MPLNRHQKEFLLDAGFLPSEVRKFSRARTPDGGYQTIDFSGATWQNTISSRRNWVRRRLDAGWTKDEIRRAILRYYKRRAGRTPYDFLRIEYKKPRKLTDSEFIVKMKSRIRISKKFGRDYGRRMRPQMRPVRG